MNTYAQRLGFLSLGLVLGWFFFACGPLPLAGGAITLGICTRDHTTTCDFSTGQAYLCVDNAWGRLDGCPDGGCELSEDLPDGGWDSYVCAKN